jgi:hypothetical protein
VHNACRGKVPILVFAGASPFTMDGDLKGSRNEWIHWIQGKISIFDDLDMNFILFA